MATPTGTVNIVRTDTNAVVDTATLDANGNFSVTDSAFSDSGVTLQAQYLGDGSFQPGNSSPQTEQPAPPRAAVSVNFNIAPNPQFSGQPQTFSGSVTPA